jgi:hypothetical protein
MASAWSSFLQANVFFHLSSALASFPLSAMRNLRGMGGTPHAWSINISLSSSLSTEGGDGDELPLLGPAAGPAVSSDMARLVIETIETTTTKSSSPQGLSVDGRITETKEKIYIHTYTVVVHSSSELQKCLRAGRQAEFGLMPKW